MSNHTFPSNKPSHWRKFGLLYVALGVVMVAALAVFPSEERAVSRSVLALAHPSAGSSLLATLESNTLHGMREETISLEATTPPGTLINHMVVCVSAPELTAIPSSCVDVPVFRKSDASVKRTPTLVHLHATDTSGSDKILITASWVRYVNRIQATKDAKIKLGERTAGCEDKPDACQPLAEKMAMTVGPVNLGVNKLTRFAGRLSRFLKDLTLPILLLVIANWLTREASERDRNREANEKQIREAKEASEKQIREAKEASEKQNEISRRKLEKEQEEQKQIAHILLPKVMRLSGHYYLPMVSHMVWFVRTSAANSAEYADMVFYLLSFLHVTRSLKEKEGGVFFKDMAAEQLFSIANSLVRSIVVKQCGGEKGYTEILNYLDTWVMPAGERRWPRLGERPASHPQVWADLEKWLATIDATELEAIRYLFNVLAGTMRYESNEPYAHWYINSRRQNLLRLQPGIATPDPKVFGTENAEALAEFLSLLEIYRVGKEA